jgi:hypothetical protein
MNDTNTSQLLFAGLLYCCILIFTTTCYWRIFKKAGQNGFYALIPIYNIVVFLRIVGKPQLLPHLVISFMLMVLGLVLVENNPDASYSKIIYYCTFFLFLYMIFQLYRALANSFGKDFLFTLGLLLFSVVFVGILAYGDDAYIGPDGQAADKPDSDIDQIGQ